ncbi:MAG TPA: SDR family oxidoreductase [Marmoricola sp.]|jgi:NAD(P)-dependent dehydrogenase (short-subunit alcohol dehydrogenase family)|nr:SDR family oxidoreductase [Marmoricola sp.]
MSDLFSLDGRTALVTGGTRGIGSAIAIELLKAGARVIVCARKTDEIETAVAGLSALGSCEGVVADLSTPAGARALAEAVAVRTERLDILVNNAGATWGAGMEDFPEAGWDKVMDLNVKAVHYLTAAALPLLRAAASAEDPARVINIGSIDGLAVPQSETYAYSASKAAVHQLTRQHAARLAHEHILVNAIAPGMFASKMSAPILGTPEYADRAMALIPLRRIGRPEEIGGTVVYLASRAGGYTTGSVLVVDGGTAGAGPGFA